MNSVYLGLLAGLLTTIAFIPQVWKCWKTKKTRDISLLMTLLFAVGVALWLMYGLILKNPPIILWNIVTLILVLMLLVLKLKYI